MMKIDWQLLRFPFDDPRWQNKALIGVLLGAASMLLFPLSLIASLPLSGYGLRLMRNTTRGAQPSLPEWDDWGELFTDGIKAWVVGFVYGLPLIVITCCFYGSFFLMIPLFASIEENPRMVFAAAGSMLLFEVLIFVVMAVVFWLAIPTVYLASVGLTRLAATGSLGSAFQFGEVWRLGRRGFRNYLLAFIGLYGVLGIASIVVLAVTYTIILACLYPVLMGALMFFSMVFSGALLGQAYYHTEGAPALVEASPAPALPKTAPLAAKEEEKKPRTSARKKKETPADTPSDQ